MNINILKMIINKDFEASEIIDILEMVDTNKELKIWKRIYDLRKIAKAQKEMDIFDFLWLIDNVTINSLYNNEKYWLSNERDLWKLDLHKQDIIKELEESINEYNKTKRNV